jgi:hypothetical protein
VDELLAVENQTELILENAPAELLAQIAALVSTSGARVVEQRKPQTTLERLFLEATPGTGTATSNAHVQRPKRSAAASSLEFNVGRWTLSVGRFSLMQQPHRAFSIRRIAAIASSP